MTEKSEWQFLVDYVKDDTTDFRNAVCRSQLMALWTAYCMHNDLCVDTKMYDSGRSRRKDFGKLPYSAAGRGLRRMEGLDAFG